jgi:hypothetical protein
MQVGRGVKGSTDSGVCSVHNAICRSLRVAVLSVKRSNRKCLSRSVDLEIDSLEKASLDDAGLIVSQLATALLLGPQLAADSLPAIPSRTGQAVVLATASAGTRGTAV